MIPTNYNEWYDCIVNKCGIPLTKEFAEKRLEVYSNNSNPETIKFQKLYGINHLNNVIDWLNQVS